MFILSLILMIAGFVGVLACAKLQKTQPNIQPVAVLCALVMLTGFGIYFYEQMFPQPDLETPRIYQASQAYAAGNFLKKDFGGKQLYLVVDASMKEHDFTKSMAEALTQTYGSAPTIVTPTGEREMMSFDAKQYNALFDQCKGGAVVCCISIMGDAKVLNNINVLKAKSGTAVFLLNPEPSKVIYKYVLDGRIAGVCCGKKGQLDPDFKPKSKDLQGAFDSRYTVVSKENIKEYKELFAF